MVTRVEAIYEDGALRPVAPLALAEHERVTITLEPYGDYHQLIDHKFMAQCRAEVAKMEPFAAGLAGEFMLLSWFSAAACPFPDELAVNRPGRAGQTGMRTGTERQSKFISTMTFTSHAPVRPGGAITLSWA